jgi:hypothetical protein
VVSVVVLVGGLAVSPMAGAVAAGALFGVALAVVVWRRRAVRALMRRRVRAVSWGRAAALADLRAVGDEYRAFLERFRDADGDEARMRALIASFADLGDGADRRET